MSFLIPCASLVRRGGAGDKLNTEQRAERLFELVQARKTLLVLDGLEPLQYGHERQNIGGGAEGSGARRSSCGG